MQLSATHNNTTLSWQTRHGYAKWEDQRDMGYTPIARVLDRIFPLVPPETASAELRLRQVAEAAATGQPIPHIPQGDEEANMFEQVMKASSKSRMLLGTGILIFHEPYFMFAHVDMAERIGDITRITMWKMLPTTQSARHKFEVNLIIHLLHTAKYVTGHVDALIGYVSQGSVEYEKAYPLRAEVAELLLAHLTEIPF